MIDRTTTWWWLSFCDDKRNRGIALIEAESFETAVRATHELGINPGGEVAGWPMPASVGDPPKRFRYCLIHRDDAEQMSLEWTGVGMVKAPQDDSNLKVPASGERHQHRTHGRRPEGPMSIDNDLAALRAHLQPRIDAEDREVKALCYRIGYGRVMQAAEKMWHEFAQAHDLNGSEFTVGPCAAFMVPCPCLIDDRARDENGHCDWCCGAGRVTERVRRAITEAIGPHHTTKGLTS